MTVATTQRACAVARRREIARETRVVAADDFELV
jgi:hypothetical protein